MPHPHSSIKILALLTHFPRSAADLAYCLGTAVRTVRKQVANLDKWQQIYVHEEKVRMVDTGRTRKDGKALFTPIRTRYFTLGDRGRARLDRKGGHDQFCPECIRLDTTKKKKAKKRPKK